MDLKITYIGHSAFHIVSNNGCSVLIDPFISGNPCAKFDLNNANIGEIFVTHGHSDHLGDAIPISLTSKAPIYTVFELANYCMSKGAGAVGTNIGGKVSFDWGWAKFLPAFHSSSLPDGSYAGMPASILFDICGFKIYHAGDTCLNTEMKLIGEIYRPDIALLPVGSCYTMDADDAVIAAKYLGVKAVIPMHYNTFPAINVDCDLIKAKFAKANINCMLLTPQESAVFDVE